LAKFITDSNGILSLKHTSVRGSKLKREPFSIISGNAATVQITLAQPIDCRAIAMLDGPAEPPNRKMVIFGYRKSLMVEDTYVILGIGVAGVGGDLIMLERQTAVWPNTQPVIISRTQPFVCSNMPQTGRLFEETKGASVVFDALGRVI